MFVWVIIWFLPNFCSIMCEVVAYGWLKTKKKLKLLTRKVVMIAYERWLLTRGFKNSNVKFLVFRKNGR